MADPLRSRFPAGSSQNAGEVESLKRNAWVNQGTVIASVDDPRLSWDQQELLRQIGTKLYGRRRAQSGN